MNVRRILTYYYYKLLRLRGNPTALAGGAGIGVLVGLTPTIPFHTILILLLTLLTRTSTIAAIIVSWIVFNPLTFLPIYYFSVQIGNLFTPYNLDWNRVKEIVEHLMASDGIMQSVSLFFNLGYETTTVLLVGGFMFASPFACVSYFFMLRFFTKSQNNRRIKNQQLNSRYNMSSYGNTRKDLKEHSLAPKKKFGQNFLVHKQTAEAIVRAGEVSKDDIIVEIGVGLGALTVPMAQQAKHVYGIEIDQGIIRYHEKEQDLPDNVTLIHQDVLKSDFDSLIEKCGGKLKILANLPYSISHPLIFKLIDYREHISQATIMLQLEVAERLMAEPSTKEYGIPTVLLACCSTIKKKMILKPAEFHPRPKIDSAVITIDFTQSPEFEEYDYTLFKKIVRTTFSQRRKTILNTLSGADLFYKGDRSKKEECKKLTEQVIITSGLKPNLRPEVLSVSDFVNLAVNFEKEIIKI